MKVFRFAACVKEINRLIELGKSMGPDYSELVAELEKKLADLYKPKSWARLLDGKTVLECLALSYIILDSWTEEVE